MGRRSWQRLPNVAFIVAVGLLAVACGYAAFVFRPAVGPSELIVVGDARWTSGGETSLRVRVIDRDEGPIVGARVAVSWLANDSSRPVRLFDAQTGADGSALPAFRVPEGSEGTGIVHVEAETPRWTDSVDGPVVIEPDLFTVVATDKPLYEAGDSIRVRASVSRRTTGRPAVGEDVELILIGGKDERLARQTSVTSELGIASATLPLPGTTRSGRYVVRARARGLESSRIVRVQDRLPVPTLDVSIEPSWESFPYGSPVVGAVVVRDQKGKPGSDLALSIDVSSLFPSGLDEFGDASYFSRTVGHREGRTDEEGSFGFHFGSMESRDGWLVFEATVTPRTGRPERFFRAVPNAWERFRIEAVTHVQPLPGNARPVTDRPGNPLYLVTSYPDGTPANVSLETSSAVVAARSSAGVTKVLIPTDSSRPSFFTQLQVHAFDEVGNPVRSLFSVYSREGHPLLWTNHATYAAGETMKVHVESSPTEGTYLDVVGSSVYLARPSVPAGSPSADFEVVLPTGLDGAVTLCAYRIGDGDAPTMERHQVEVQRADDLAILVRTLAGGGSRKIYLKAIDIRSGGPVEAAMSVTIAETRIDELAPETSTLRFVEKGETRQIRVPVSLANLVDDERGSDLPLREALDARLRLQSRASYDLPGLFVDSRVDRSAQAAKRLPRGFWRLSVLGVTTALVAALLAAFFVTVELRRQRILLTTSLWTTALVFGPLALRVLVLLERDYIRRSCFDCGDGATTIVAWALAFAAASLSMGFLGARGGDPSARWLCFAGIGWFSGLLFFAFAVAGRDSLDRDWIAEQEWSTGFWVVCLASLVLMGSLVARARQLWLGARRRESTLAVLGALLLFALFLAPHPHLSGSTGLRKTCWSEDSMVADLFDDFDRVAGARLGLSPFLDSPLLSPLPPPIPPPRIPRLVPRTLLWEPEVMTDEDGSVTIDLPDARDGNVRLTVEAVTGDGRRGRASELLRLR